MRTGEIYKGVSYYYFSRIKTGALKRDIPFNITLKILGDLWEKQKDCPYSNITLIQCKNKSDTEYTASLDRIDPSKGYQPHNIQWVWKPLNKMKGDYTDEEFKIILEKIRNGTKNLPE